MFDQFRRGWRAVRQGRVLDFRARSAGGLAMCATVVVMAVTANTGAAWTIATAIVLGITVSSVVVPIFHAGAEPDAKTDDLLLGDQEEILRALVVSALLPLTPEWKINPRYHSWRKTPDEESQILASRADRIGFQPMHRWTEADGAGSFSYPTVGEIADMVVRHSADSVQTVISEI